MVNYKKIFEDIIELKFPHKREVCLPYLKKEKLYAIDVIELTKIIFDYKTKNSQKHRAYSKSDILKILDEQKRNGYNNSQLAAKLNISRNSIAKWRRQFL